MKCIIIDDEPSSIEFLETVIKEYCAGLQIVAKANNINDAHQAILTHEPDLLLLDIEMPDGTGFDLLKRFDKPNFEIIFITGFNQYLLNAIRFCALDFLLKPININEFKTAIERAAVKVSEKKNNERLHLMLQNIATPNAQRLLIPTSTGYEIMPVQEIIRCEALDAYTQVHTNDKRKLIASKTIKEYEEVLINHGFFRVHNSHIVNKLHIKRYKKNDGGIVVMSDNAEIIIARRRKDDFLEWLKNDNYVPDIH